MRHRKREDEDAVGTKKYAKMTGGVEQVTKQVPRTHRLLTSLITTLEFWTPDSTTSSYFSAKRATALEGHAQEAVKTKYYLFDFLLKFVFSLLNSHFFEIPPQIAVFILSIILNFRYLLLKLYCGEKLLVGHSESTF